MTENINVSEWSQIASIKGGAWIQSVSVCLIICLMQRDIFALSWSTCWLWPVQCSPTLQLFCEVTGYWQELERTIGHIDPEHHKHAQWVTCLVSMQAMGKTGTFSVSRNSVQILVTWGHALSCVAVMAEDEWHNSGPSGSCHYICAFKLLSI